MRRGLSASLLNMGFAKFFFLVGMAAAPFLYGVKSLNAQYRSVTSPAETEKTVSSSSGGFADYQIPDSSASASAKYPSSKSQNQTARVSAPASSSARSPEKTAANTQNRSAKRQAAGKQTAGKKTAEKQESANAPQPNSKNQKSGSASVSDKKPQSGVLPENPENGDSAQTSAADANGILPPPEDYNVSPEEEALLDEFLQKWEDFGKNIKKVACSVQVKEQDGGLYFQNKKTPLSHTFGKFKFIAPNKLSYHVEGEFVYNQGTSSEETPKPEYKKGSGELKFVCDGKSWTEYDFENRIATVTPIPKEEWDKDLTIDGPFPLFFIANAQNLKNRFYLKIVTPKEKQEKEVLINAWPRQSADAANFQRITVALRLSDLQPYYMRKYYANGKSYSELWFENIAVNKGLWNIEAKIDFGWKKEVREEPMATAESAPEKTPPKGPKAGVLPEEEEEQ